MIATRSAGWVGVDLGSSSIKIAQVERRKGNFRLIDAVSVLRRDSNWAVPAKTQIHSCSDEIRAGLSLAGSFRNRTAGATVSLSVCDLQMVSVNGASDPHAITRALTKMGVNLKNRVVDSWAAAHTTDVSSVNGSMHGVVGIPTSWGERIAADVHRAGLRCQAIEGMPTTLARAAEITPAGREDTACAMIDLGNAGTTFIATREGRALYVRKLKCTSVGELLSRFQSELKWSSRVAWKFLHQWRGDRQGGEHHRHADSLVGDFIRSLAEEIRRTVHFLETHRPNLKPSVVYQVGGGAMIRQLGTTVAQLAEVEVRDWHPAGEILTTSEELSGSLPIFAAAISQSLLAWERS